MKRILLVLFLVIPAMLYSQKKALDHSVYDEWERLSSSIISGDGKYVSYEINPQKGDGSLFLYETKSGSNDSFDRGDGAVFSPANDYLVYRIKPEYEITQQAKRDKKKPYQMPKNDMGIKILGEDNVKIIERVKSFKLPGKEGDWMALLKEKELPEKKKKDEEGEEEKEEKEKTKEKKSKQKGTELLVINPLKGAEYSFKNVLDYEPADKGTAIAYVSVTTDTAKTDTYTVSVFDTDNEASKQIFTGEGELTGLEVYKEGNSLAFLYSSDTSDVKVFDLYYWDGNECNKIVANGTEGMPEGWSVSKNGSLSFSDSGERLFFGTAEKPVEEPEDTLLAEEKFRLDIWSWHDPLLQPQQKQQLDREKKRTYTAVYHVNSEEMVQLATEEIPGVRFFNKKDGDVVIGSSNLKYLKLTSWDANRYRDYYLIDINTGESELILEKAPSSVVFSPSGERMLFWSIESKSWKSRPTAGGDLTDLTSELDVMFHDELNDSPSEPRPYGVINKWVEGEKYALVYDRYDIWKIDVTGEEKPVMITGGYGRDNSITLRYDNLKGRSWYFSGGDEEEYFDKKADIYLSAFSEKTKDAGLFKTRIDRYDEPGKIIMEPYSFRSVAKAEDDNTIVFQKGSFEQYPELYVSDLKFRDPVKISETNPQQSEYVWGTSELVEWNSFDGHKLQGILYKPENFDPGKKYPMIAYFYERSSDGLHRHYTPSPSASVINRIYAVSNGYLLFVPDIPYKEGYPGESCYDAVVSGTQAMLERHDYIDENRLGLDGQSWGGYQIAYLITQTDMFTCAFSGAPVSNMTSAYGGIRWGSGMSRMFQYEQTQSRIGGTLWEKPLHYIENSPVFFVPKINTPVLIMHNDDDGAVPWYQGIEFFVALRRLEKPAWMLSYNDEAHNLRRRANRKDLSIRKMQFFDHYLQGEAMPYWMKEGISQMEKGKKDGYKLMK